MKRTLTIVGILVVIIGGSLLAWRAIAQAQTPQTPTYETVTATRGSLQSTVSATGTIEPEAQVSLSFRGVGRVADIGVTAGQEVQAGDVLARLDAQELELAVAQAEAGLASAKANLAQLTKPARAEDLAAAEAAAQSAQALVKSAEAGLSSTRAAYAKLQRGSTENEKKVAAANLERARVALEQAQAAYDRVASSPDIGLLPQSGNLQRATIDFEAAKAQYDITTAGADDSQRAQALAAVAQSESSVISAKAQVAQAQASLAKLREGASPEQIAVSQAQVKQAETGLAQARLNLDNTVLKSPIAGIVAEINAKVGELPNAARPAFVVINPEPFHLDVAVDEIDIGQLAIGQDASVTLEALPNAVVTGIVDRIAPTARFDGGVTSYPVRVVLNPTTAALRAGMSATANITTAAVDNVVVLPNRAIQADRNAGTNYVEKLVDGIPQRREVRVGMRNEGQTQIVEGVAEGDVIIIPNTSASDQLRSMFGF